VELLSLPANEGGALNVFTTATKGQFSGGTGAGVAIRHDQENLLGTGLTNNLWVQYAQGSAGLNSNFGTSPPAAMPRAGAWWKASAARSAVWAARPWCCSPRKPTSSARTSRPSRSGSRQLRHQPQLQVHHRAGPQPVQARGRRHRD
jgi:hypothetical protein